MKLYIFDLDGVLVSTSENHYHAWKRMANDIGIDIDQKFNETLKGIPRDKSLERILEHGKKTVTDAEKARLLEYKNELYKKSIATLKPEDLYPGAKALLDELKTKNKAIALASASRNAPVILERLGITEYFDVIIDPATLENNKPDPEIFLKAAKTLNIKPKDAIGIEDAKAGIKAINAAKMFSVGIGYQYQLMDADITFPSISQFDLNLVERLFKT